jgi:hypothetical protein
MECTLTSDELATRGERWRAVGAEGEAVAAVQKMFGSLR